MGREGCGTMNDNRERLLDICTTYDFVIGGTLFPHQDVHKLTWYSPKGRDKKQIYHLMINGIWRRPLLGVRVRRGADVGSDHHLVTTTLKLKLRKTESSPRGQQHFHVEKLRDLEAETTFTPQLKDKFQVLADAEDQTQEGSGDINAKWQQLKIAYEQTCKACLGTKQRKRKEWITEDTWQAIENRRTLKKKVLEAKSEQLKERYKQQHSEANPAAKRMTRTDKRSHISDLPSKPGRRCSKQGRARQSLQDHQAGVWQVCGRGTDALIMDKQGRLITTEAEQDARGTEHFSEVLNRPPPPPTEADIQEAETDLDVNTDPPGKEEIIAPIKSFKNGKSPRQDNLSAEVFKADPQLAGDLLQPLFAGIWEGKKLPED